MSEDKYQLQVQVEDPEDIPEKLGSGVPKTPYVSVLDEGGYKVTGEYTDEKGCVSFELPEGRYKIFASSLTETGSEEVDLRESEKVSLETELRNLIKDIPF